MASKPLEFLAYEPQSLPQRHRQYSTFEEDGRASPALPIQPTIEGQIEAETPEVSQLSTQQHIESCDPQGSPTKMAPLTKAEVLVLSRLANRNAEAYRPGSKTGFWSHLQEDFAKETGKQHKSLHQVLRQKTERRRAYLDSLGTGQTDSESELTVQIDNWIDVVGEEERLNKERSEAANTVLTSSQRAQDIRDSLSVALAAKRKYQRNPPKSRDKSIGSAGALRL
ncbi:hypothetical protein GMDG_07495 [Pseudogymnoascus destructans 20631-21]|uniref:Uncharacterized protein n=1 Tax=Pseudogymnoascus destructans (strain ATCC MYA-4855 / 20631-21) TaxID=658429 RepID=L8FXU7_PSED2|nr:hypothetical protein GMDG_07495 [Pseudogymnoascus destructans 20631-21]